jgi:2-keto-4-pentenoate hydratase/2-oxohepta-3-ene-1,7-dioic acid hydratase in catechol pathway
VKLIAYQSGAGAIMARVLPEGRLEVLCPVAEFWSAPHAGLGSQVTPSSLTIDQVEHVPPVPPGAHVLCAGRNYAAHASEINASVPQRPELFGRWASTLTVNGHPVPVPPREDHLDWEGELAAILGGYLDAASG